MRVPVVQLVASLVGLYVWWTQKSLTCALAAAIGLVTFKWITCDLGFPVPTAKILPPPPSSKKSEGENGKEKKKKICVIGGGFVGLGLGAELKRNGFDFDILEGDSKIGGNWNHGVYDSVHIISSKKTTQFTDFPMPESYPDFPSAKQVMTYLESYAEYNRLYENIEFNTMVTHCDPIANGDSWRVKLSKTVKTQQQKGEEKEQVVEEEREYGAVVVAIGHHWSKRMPHFDKIDNFDGLVIHSKDFKSTDIFRGKRVLTVGGGNSACDIAVEAARHGISSDLSVRRGYWFLPRSIMGKPTIELMPWYLPRWAIRLMIRCAARIVVGPYECYGLPHPDHEPMEHHPTINSELLAFIKLGKISPNGDILRFCGGKKIEFKPCSNKKGEEEKKSVKEFDVVVFATGYEMKCPMIDHLLTYRDGIPQLVGGSMHPTLKNLYVSVGGQVRYGAGPLISAGATNLVLALRAQEFCSKALGAILLSLGVPIWRKSRKSADVLLDPFTNMRLVTMGKIFIPLLPFMERYVLPLLPSKKDRSSTEKKK